MVQRLKATINQITDLTDDIRNYSLELEEPMNYKAGQFINIQFEENQKRQIRPYSIASHPDNNNKIDLCVKQVKGGLFTPKLWEMNENDELNIMGPLGLFTTEKIQQPNILLIGTGAGIAPLRGILKDELQKGFEGHIHLIFGARYNGEHCYNNEFEELEKNNPNFKYTPILSKPNNNWLGREGYVQQHLDGIDYQQTTAFLCGSPQMVEQVKEELILRGMNKEDIHEEKY